jgi:hypothetical protein
MPAKSSGAISASLIILILVAAAIGAITALALSAAGLGEAGFGTRTFALICGFVATLVASIARYKVIFLGAGKGADESKVPGLVLTYAAIASVAGSLAAHDLFSYLVVDGPLAFLGALAGLLSAVLMAMLMITYHTNSQTA